MDAETVAETTEEMDVAGIAKAEEETNGKTAVKTNGKTIAEKANVETEEMHPRMTGMLRCVPENVMKRVKMEHT